MTWIYHGCSWVPHPEPPSHLPPHTIPLGHPSAPALSTLYQASNLDWRFISHMIIYMFQCHSPKSFHPTPLPQSPKDCSIHLCIYMEFRKMVMMTLDVRQQKRQRCKEQTFGLYGRSRGWEDLRQWHWNMYIIICEINHESRFIVRDRLLRAGALGWPWGMGWGGRWEAMSGWGTHVNPWLIHVNVGQKNHQNFVKEFASN